MIRFVGALSVPSVVWSCGVIYQLMLEADYIERNRLLISETGNGGKFHELLNFGVMLQCFGPKITWFLVWSLAVD